jgi:hypothetical protein
MLDSYAEFHALADVVGLVITLIAIALIIVATVRVRQFDRLVKSFRESAREIGEERRRELPGDSLPCPHRRLSDHFCDGNVFLLPEAKTPWRRDLQRDMASRIKPK